MENKFAGLRNGKNEYTHTCNKCGKKESFVTIFPNEEEIEDEVKMKGE